LKLDTYGLGKIKVRVKDASQSWIASHRIHPKPCETGELRFVLPFDKEITNVIVQVK
jgi:hypothetical protein